MQTAQCNTGLPRPPAAAGRGCARGRFRPARASALPVHPSAGVVEGSTVDDPRPRSGSISLECRTAGLGGYSGQVSGLTGAQAMHALPRDFPCWTWTKRQVPS